MRYFNKLLISLFFIGVSQVLVAGTACKASKLIPADFIKQSHVATKVVNSLNKTNPKVALIARQGSNLSRYHQRFSHIAFVVRDYPGAKGKWTVVHLLNECGTKYSSIYRQGVMNFFMDNLYSLDYEIIKIDKKIQHQLFNELTSKLIQRLHGNRYSMLAYPFSTKYQNSNQWVLEILAKAYYPNKVKSRCSAQRVLLKTGYHPTLVTIQLLDKLGASLFKPTIKFDDHPRKERIHNRYSVVSVKSVEQYIKKQHG